VRDRIARVCGVASVSLGFGVEPTVEAMKEAVAALRAGARVRHSDHGPPGLQDLSPDQRGAESRAGAFV
jgi:hypothetical protein